MSSPRQLDNSMFATCLLLRQEAEEVKVVDCLRMANQGCAIGVRAAWARRCVRVPQRSTRRLDESSNTIEDLCPSLNYSSPPSAPKAKGPMCYCATSLYTALFIGVNVEGSFYIDWSCQRP